MLYSEAFVLYNLPKRAHMKKKWLIAIIAYVALLLVCVAVIYIVPSVRGLLDKTYVTKYGTISIDDEVRAYIVRDEIVYVAKYDADFTRQAEAGTLYKAAAKILDFNVKVDENGEQIASDASEISRKYRSIIETLGDATSLTKGKSKVAGYVSYYIDGAEEKLSTSHLEEITEKEFKELSNLRQVEVQDRKCTAGEPVFKIIPNRKWYLVFFIDNKGADRYYAGQTVYIDIDGEQVPVSVRSVEAVPEEGKDTEEPDPSEEPPAEDQSEEQTSEEQDAKNNDKGTSKVILTCKMFNGELISERKFDARVTVASASGLVLKDSSIVEKDGQKGVFVKNKLGEHKFRPISVKADNGEECVAYSDIYVDEGGNFVETIGTYDEIVEVPDEDDINSLNGE